MGGVSLYILVSFRFFDTCNKSRGKNLKITLFLGCHVLWDWQFLRDDKQAEGVSFIWLHIVPQFMMSWSQQEVLHVES